MTVIRRVTTRCTVTLPDGMMVGGIGRCGVHCGTNELVGQAVRLSGHQEVSVRDLTDMMD